MRTSLMRLGIGEYSPPGLDTARFDARQQFIHALLRRDKEIGDELTERLDRLPATDRSDERIGEVVAGWAVDRGLPPDLVHSGIMGFDLFDAALPKGRRGRHRNWGGDIAYEWITARRGEVPDIGARGAEDESGQSGAFTFHHPGDDLARCTLADLREELRAAFERSLADWTARIEGTARERGWPRTEVKRRSKGQPSRNDHARHFDWLVRFQMLKHTHSSIARNAGVSEQSVREAVRLTAKMADIPLRTDGRPGRPRKHPAKPRRNSG